MSVLDIADQNMVKLHANVYPGRGIVLGQSPDGRHLIQVYWIMGRSANSRNRIFAMDGSAVKTAAFDETKVEDPSLIIYYPARVYQNAHIITNGDQTDTIFDSLQKGGTFESALDTRTFEPDAPNFTPRISGIIDLDSFNAYQLSILKSTANDGRYINRHFFNYQNVIPGVGHCIHTYVGDGNPLPSFKGEPYPVRLFNELSETAQSYWKILNPENKIALMVKFINIQTQKVAVEIFNKHLGD
jgi:hypothetical protein